MKKRILSILLALCMLFCLVPTTAFAADCAEDLVDPVIWIHLSSDGGGYYDVLNGTWTAADFFQPGKAPKGAKITAVTPPTSPSIPVSVNVNSDGTLNCTKTENTTEPVPKSETYTVTITSDDYAPISAPLTVRQYLNAGFRGPVYFDDELLYGDTYTYTCRVNNPGENGVWSALIQDPQMFEIYKETTDTTSEPGKSIYTVHIRAIKAGARVTCIDFLYVSDTTMASSKVSRGAVTGGAVRTRPLTVTAGSATITEGNALPTDLVTCTGLLNSEGRKDDRDTVLDNALGYQLLDANNEEVTAATARNMPGTYTVVPAATLKSGWGERYSLNKVNGTLTVENQPDEQFTLAPGGRYYFDLSTMNIPGTVNSNLPDSTLHYVPFTYVGTVNAYKLTSETATTNEYAQQNKYAHSLFVADYAVTHKVNWNNLDTASLIFGKDYVAGGVDYTLRAPSCGSGFTGSGDSECGTPQSNEWDAVLDKNSGYIQNWNKMYSWGQDTSSYELWYRALRGSNSARRWLHSYAKSSYSNRGFRPVLEVRNPNTLGPDGLKVVTLDLGGGKLGNSSEDIQIIVKNGESFTAPATEGLSRPNSISEDAQLYWSDENGNCYKPGDTVPADVSMLSITGDYEVIYLPGTYGTGSAVTDMKPHNNILTLRGALFTRAGYTQVGWSTVDGGEKVYGFEDVYTQNEALTLYPVWNTNKYTITFDTNGGSEIAPITQDYGTEITAPDNPTRKGYTFKGWDKEIPKTMPAENITITARWKDTEKPTGEIIIGTNKWNEFLNELTFGIFFKDTQEVTINAVDNSGVVFVSYLVTDKELSEAELNSLVFRAYEEPFSIDPNGEYIVYVMLVDENINITYLRSDRITLDNIQPVISGIENGKTYCEAQTVTVDEKYVDTVTVNGTAVTLDADGGFVLPPTNGEQKIVVTDKAGNNAEVTVTVNNGHTFGEWVSDNDGKHTRKCTVDGCDAFETENCSGGNATCTEKAVCDVCGKAYGEFDGTSHEGGVQEWTTRTAFNHEQKWNCCGAVIVASEAHEWKDGVCRECGYVCLHNDTDKDHICDYCKKTISAHEDAPTEEIKKADTVTAKLPDDSKSPQTGDNSNLILWIALLLISGGVMKGVTAFGKSKKHSAKIKDK